MTSTDVSTRTGLFEALLRPAAAPQAPAAAAALAAAAAALASLRPAATEAELAAALLRCGGGGGSGSGGGNSGGGNEDQAGLSCAVAKLAWGLARGARGAAPASAPAAAVAALTDGRVAACVVLALASCGDEAAPSPVRAGADTVFAVSGAGSAPGGGGNSGSSSPPATSVVGGAAVLAATVRRDEKRAALLARELPAAFGAASRALALAPEAVSAASLLMQDLFSQRRVVAGLQKQSVVLGGVGAGATAGAAASANASAPGGVAVLERSSSGVVVEDCCDVTVFVTACVPFLFLRRCRRCTIVAAPTALVVNADDCSQCAISACAPVVALKNCHDLRLFTWAQSPLAVLGDSRDIVTGPYNVVAPGLLARTPLGSWATSGSASTAAAPPSSAPPSGGGGSGAVSAEPSRRMRLEEFYRRFLPILGASADGADGEDDGSDFVSESGDRLATDFFANEEAAASAAAAAGEGAASAAAVAAELAALDVNAARRAEVLLQAAFVTWLLEDERAAGLKNSLR